MPIIDCKLKAAITFMQKFVVLYSVILNRDFYC